MKKIQTTKDKRWKYITLKELNDCNNVNPRELDYIIIKHPPKDEDTEWKECDGKNIIEEIREKYINDNLWIISISPDHICIFNPKEQQAKYIMGSPEGIFHQLLNRDGKFQSLFYKKRNKTLIQFLIAV